MQEQLGQEIGRGGFGIVYTMKDDPSMCIKVSNKSKGTVSCRQWSNEFKKITSFVEKIETNPEYKKLKMVRVIRPLEFVETEKDCYMVLPRIFRPEGRFSTLPTIQAQLGWKSGRMMHKSRGEFIGFEELQAYVSKKDLEIVAHELGIMMGLIHFIGKNDAYDVELYFGKEAGAKKPRFYLADFDLSESIKSYDEDTISRMTWSLDAVPYFPREDVDPDLYETFRLDYKQMEDQVGVADKVFEAYG